MKYPKHPDIKKDWRIITKHRLSLQASGEFPPGGAPFYKIIPFKCRPRAYHIKGNHIIAIVDPEFTNPFIPIGSNTEEVEIFLLENSEVVLSFGKGTTYQKLEATDNLNE